MDVDKLGCPPSCQNISFDFRDAMCQDDPPSRAHPEIIVTVQSPSGNNSDHPPGNLIRGPYTKHFLHF